MSFDISFPSEYVLLYSEFPNDDSLVSWVIKYAPILDKQFLGAIIDYQDEINTSTDFLEFILWWESRKTFRLNYMKSSYFGLIQQYLGLLNEFESGYIDERMVYWQKDVPFRQFLDHLISNFPA
jgi:hypothetical protein